MDRFKLPQTIPQDLLLIQEFVDIPETTTIKPDVKLPQLPVAKQDDEDIASSGSESEVGDDMDSEDEIAANLIQEEDEEAMKEIESTSEPSDSSSESDLSEDEADGQQNDRKRAVMNEFDDDEDPVQAPSGNYFTTKNELIEGNVAIPEVDELAPEEILEKVGEVMSIVDQVAIVRGLPSEYLNRASERALDSETLLVFNDRKVMGYIYETFGPTMQPLYQVKFSSAFPLNPERVIVGREVFHVPARSRFIFISQIKAYKGSDASNVHDEEPADDELEFSDDEAEAAYKSRLKRRRAESRGRSASSSRASTPNPSLMRDQELADEAFFSRNAYDEHGPYDIDYNAQASSSSSRPTPIPYDDPYGDAYTAPDVVEREAHIEPSLSRPPSFSQGRPPRGRGRGRGDSGYQRDRGRGRGQARGRGRDRGGPRYQEGRQMSPTSMTIARITSPGNYPPYSPQGQSEYSPLYPEQPSNSGYVQPQPYQHQFNPQSFMPVQQNASVQPHINPRFANVFGLAMYPNGRTQGQGYPFGQAPQQSSDPSNWRNAWLGPGQQGHLSGHSGENPMNDGS